jgi:hypothetical protein
MRVPAVVPSVIQGSSPCSADLPVNSSLPSKVTGLPANCAQESLSVTARKKVPLAVPSLRYSRHTVVLPEQLVK